jgi:molecular chaperone DnaK (HSP70)
MTDSPPRTSRSNTARFVVGVDLGTTNSAVAFVDTAESARRARSLPIPQLVGEGTIGERATLPSFLYVAGEHDVAPGALALPWDAGRNYAVGEFARLQGARVPGRLVTSAKSWLCHGGVDREARILPWAAPDDVPRLSPVDASARYLQHIREAWGRAHPGAPLEQQDVILTVPASFDEVARELTVEAARRAGLERVVLLEEPQAAFYAWIHAHESDWQQLLAGVRLALVVDVGGGTSDFSLVAVRPEGATCALERLAVGDHILLGGDNIDVALARLLEPRLGEKLDSQRWYALTSACRDAKEILLGADPPSEVPIRIAGRGRSVVGGLLSTTLTRKEVLDLVLDGFFPLRGAADLPRRQQRGGLQEWGLPFADEPEVPRHIAAFLSQHARDAAAAAAGGDAPSRPDAVLFNGGALKPQIVRERLAELLASWNDGRQPAILESADLDLAVARGAAYYGLARRGIGVRIGGGSPRSYFLGIAGKDTEESKVRAICLLPRGIHEGEEVELTERDFTVVANRPVSFPLFASSTRLGDRAGEIVEVERESIGELPPIRTVLRFGKKLAATEIPVHVLGKLTEVGTLEVWCRSLKTDHRWRLQFALRERTSDLAAEEGEERSDSADLEVAPERIEAAANEIRATFSATPATDGDPVYLVRRLEEALGAGKDAWPIDAIRQLWDVLWEAKDAAARTDRHEARWLNLAGFLLRPGFGHELDGWRLQQLWRLISTGLRFPRATQGRVEWWNMWKRVAGGLSRTQQQELYNQVAPMLVPRLRSKAKGGSSFVGPQEVREYWQLVASCERLAAATKAELGALLVKPIAKGKATDAEIWVLGRLGARAPFAGPLNCVVAKDVVEQWVGELLEASWKRPDSVSFAMVQLARCVGDRERDLDEDLRRRLAARLRDLPAGERAARLVTEIVPLGRQERARILAESLPVGLQVREDGDR